MRKQSYGRIVMTTSAAGLFGNLGQTNYANATKRGVLGLMRALKIQGKKRNIRVNAVSPIADTRMGAKVFPDFFKAMIQPELVAAAVTYLASEACTASGDILVTAAGYFAKVQLMEGEGVAFAADAIELAQDVRERGEALRYCTPIRQDTAGDDEHWRSGTL